RLAEDHFVVDRVQHTLVSHRLRHLAAELQRAEFRIVWPSAETSGGSRRDSEGAGLRDCEGAGKRQRQVVLVFPLALLAEVRNATVDGRRRSGWSGGRGCGLRWRRSSRLVGGSRRRIDQGKRCEHANTVNDQPAKWRSHESPLGKGTSQWHCH